MSFYLISQVLVGIAILFDILSFQFKDRKRIVQCLFVSGTLISTHFFLLGHQTAGFLMLVATLRYLTSVFTTSPRAMALFIGLALMATALTFEGMLSVLSCVGTTFHTAGAFSKNDKRLRILMIIGTLFWIPHNYLASSPVAVAMELLFLSSNLVGYYRHYLKGRNLFRWNFSG
ncbi:YgjV family protein [Halodesulfovibrio marinisediminis]|uniref:Inner membrane protein n=1 Tax=Halodesulfovibrio marinisediminis DSM 17456 TaxID=1121457 RepID=A0A1N6E9E3_9BACT|nr:YgjV family protein [Halodesulfovibrio marinisediminis]SIN79650.1 inner membrane protein [Halodesulfovibrio marinisediminis DSM 17456]